MRFAVHLTTAIISLAILASSSRAQERFGDRSRLTFEFESALTSPTASADISVGIFEGVPFTTKELEVGKALQTEGKISWNIGSRHTIGGAISSVSFSGDKRVLRERRVGPLRFRFNERVISAADLHQWKAFYEYRLDVSPRLSVSPQVELRTLRSEGTLATPEARRPLKEAFSKTITSPLAGAVVRYRLSHRASLETRFLGLHIPAASVAETDIQLRLRLADRIILRSGWQYSFFSSKRSKNHFDAQLRQPYLGVEYAW